MSVTLKCAACGHEVPFVDEELETEAICPGCEVMLRPRSKGDKMAIPVSMALPDQFEPADLGRVPKHNQEMIHRYHKPGTTARAAKTGDPLSDSNLVLARAIERLAMSIEKNGSNASANLASVIEGGFSTDPMHTNGANGSHSNGNEVDEVPVLNGGVSANGKTESVDENGKALPVVSPVLVRREAAAEAHRYQRRTQAATDIKGPVKSGLTKWIEAHPILMLVTGLILIITLVVLTTMLMTGAFTDETENNVIIKTMSGESGPSDANQERAEKEARGFLNAVALNPARPYIFRATAIGPKLEKFYQPLPDPADYEVVLTGKRKIERRSIYYYQVRSAETNQPLVVLQEDDTFKVFWEYGACVGDISWQSFLDAEPASAVLMRAFMRPEPIHDSRHSQSEWTAWYAEDWNGNHSVRVYVRKDSAEDRRLKAAYQNHRIKRKQNSWIMAQVRLLHTGNGTHADHLTFETAEVIEVPLASWLPEEFVEGDTFYNQQDKANGLNRDLPGFQPISN